VTTLLPPPTRATAETPRAGAVAVACIIVRVVVGSRPLYALPTSRCSLYLGKQPKLDEVSLGFGCAVVWAWVSRHGVYLFFFFFETFSFIIDKVQRTTSRLRRLYEFTTSRLAI
jgi:hypothetical protein